MPVYHQKVLVNKRGNYNPICEHCGAMIHAIKRMIFYENGRKIQQEPQTRVCNFCRTIWKVWTVKVRGFYGYFDLEVEGRETVQEPKKESIPREEGAVGGDDTERDS